MCLEKSVECYSLAAGSVQYQFTDKCSPKNMVNQYKIILTPICIMELRRPPIHQ